MKTVSAVEPEKAHIERIESVPPGLEGLERLAWLMDQAFKIPGTPIRVGLDAIIGLLPFGGDFVTGLIQAGIVVVAMTRYKVPRPIAARMAANVLLDVVVGSIPLVGDVFDAFFKANTRNLQLISHVAKQRIQNKQVETAPSVLYLIGLAAAVFGVIALVLIGFITVVIWLIKAIQT